MDKYTRSIEAVTKKFGTSYYFATRFLPEDLKQATYALYSFFRIPDEIVDNSKTESQDAILQELSLWQKAWEEAYEGKKTRYPVLNLTAEVFHSYHIPYQYSIDFLSAMRQDITVSQYAHYSDLQQYMYGSASVVGLIMMYVIGFNDEKASQYASMLGEAMQMTNFIRDIGEDYQQRNRIYMPQDELAQYHINEEILKSNTITPEFVNFIQYQIHKNKELYKQANKGIKYLNRRGRFAVIMASKLYEAILGKIEQNHYDVLTKRASTSTREKVYILGKAALQHGLS